MKEKREKAVAIYHRIMRRENFETAAKDIFHLLVETQKKESAACRKMDSAQGAVSHSERN